MIQGDGQQVKFIVQQMSIYGRATFGVEKQSRPPQLHSPKTNDQYHMNNPARRKEDLPNFYGNQEYQSHIHNGMIKADLLDKLSKVSDLLYELVFLKQNVLSAVNEQKIKMTDQMRQLKKYLFQFQIKAQRESMSNKQSRISESNISNQMIVNSSSNALINNQNSQYLKQLCQNLMLQNQDLKRKYEEVLIKYQEEIQFLSAEMDNSGTHKNDIITQQNSKLKRTVYDLQEKLKNQQVKYVDKIKMLESQIIGFQQQYIKERDQYQRNLKVYKEREKSYTFQQSEIERKNILLIEREKKLTERQIILKQQIANLDRRENKVSDYEHNQLRRQKKNGEQQRYNLKNQYYASYNRIPDMPKDQKFGERIRTSHYLEGDYRTERQKSSGQRLINSRVDINTRLREIEQQKKRVAGNSGFKGSRYSQAGGMRNDRSSSKGRDTKIIGFQNRKQGIVSGDNVNNKLDTMLQLMHRDLNDIK